MADSNVTDEKIGGLGTDSTSLERDPEAQGVTTNLTGWAYQSKKIGPITVPYYASPKAQLLIVSFVCFLCPGMFNALSGVGGGGQVDPTVSNNAGVALNCTFAVMAFFGGTVCNKLGIKVTLSFGGFGYALYAASFLCYNHTANAGFVIFAGALLGVCAGLLWTAQGTIMMSYPLEKDKGRFISIFWMIFNLGGVIGSLIPLLQNLHSSSGTVNDGTYVAFFVLMLCGGFLAWALINVKKIVRKDGSRVIAIQHPTWWSEIKGLGEVLYTEPWFIALFPMFLASNWFYAYQFNDVNLANFTIRTRSLNSLLYWSAQILGALIMGYGLDIPYFKRPMRAKLGLAFVFTMTMAIWGGGLAFQLNYTRADVASKNWVKLDFMDKGYGGPLVLYICYGMFDAFWQTYVYWLMGALTNNSRKLAIYAGFYKGIQSAGAAIIFRLDAVGKPYITMFGSTWGLLAGSLIIAAPIVFWKVTDHTPVEKDVVFSDETTVDGFRQEGDR